jgi:hypothetical protein
MAAPMTASARDRAAPGAGAAFRRLALWGALLMLAACAVLAAAAVLQLQALSASEAQARAQLVAEGLAKRVQRAVSLGIPLDALQGVDTLFAERMADFPDIAALALQASDGRLLTLAGPAGATALPEGPRVEAMVLDRASRPAARLVLVRHEAALLRLMRPWMLPLLALALACATLAAESLRPALAAGVRRREAVVHAAAGAIAAGQLGVRLPLLRRREHDLRPQWLAAQLRQIRERHLRVSRLVQSLRRTEPDASRRALLDQALAQACGSDQFEDAPPLPATTQAEARLRWHALLLACAAWLLALAPVLWAGPQLRAWGPGHWAAAAALPFALGLLGAAVLARGGQGGRAQPRRELAAGLATGLLFVGPGLFMTCVLALCPEAAWPKAWPGDALALWVCGGCLCSLLPGRGPAWLRGDRTRLKPGAPVPGAPGAD